MTLATNIAKKAPEPSKRDLILDAAKTIFSHYGYKRASLEDIASEAGVSRTGIYHHFRNKEEIFKAITEDIHARAQQIAEEIANSDLPIEEKLKGILHAKMTRFYEKIQTAKHGSEMTDESSRLMGEFLALWSARYTKLMAAVLRKAEAAGEINLECMNMTPDSTAGYLYLSAKGLQGPHYERPTADQYKRRIDKLVAITCRGLQQKK